MISFESVSITLSSVIVGRKCQHFFCACDDVIQCIQLKNLEIRSLENVESFFKTVKRFFHNSVMKATCFCAGGYL